MHKRRTDYATTVISCAVEEVPTEIRFDWEHQPEELGAGLREGFVVNTTVVQLNHDILQAIANSADECVTLHVNGQAIPISAAFDRLRFGRGLWEVESPTLDNVLAEWLWEEQAANLVESMEHLAECREGR